MDALHLGEVRSMVYTHSNAFGMAYPTRWVNNLYFDTLDHQFMVDHLNGVTSRAKIRFRWYGNTWNLQGGQFEIKKKIAHLGQKDIYPFSGNLDISQSNWREVCGTLASGLMDAPPGMVELLDMLQPTLINRYKREYYLSMDGVIRLTLDYEMKTYKQSYGFKPNLCYPQNSLSNLILEMKAPKKEHQRIADVLSEFPKRCSRNSKYLNGM